MPAGQGPRVAYLVRRFPVVSQTFVIDEVRDHLAAGLDVRVIAAESERNVEYPSSALGPEFAGRVAYLDLSPSGGDASAPRPEALAGRLREVLGQTDLLHAHFGPAGRLAVMILNVLKADTKLVASFHGHDLAHADFQPLSAYYAPLFGRADLLLPVSDLWRQTLLEAGANPLRTQVQHMGVDCASLAPNTERPAGQLQALNLVMVGRLVEKKGHRTAIAALAALRDRRPGLTIVLDMIGDGPLRLEIGQEIARRGLADTIRLHGTIQHDRTLRAIASADALLQPSLTALDGDMEGIPVVLMEAMALGTPVIASRHSGIPELVEHGSEGMLVDEHDHLALAAAIERIADDTALRTTMTRAALAKVRAGFDRTGLGRKLRELYQALIDLG